MGWLRQLLGNRDRNGARPPRRVATRLPSQSHKVGPKSTQLRRLDSLFEVAERADLPCDDAEEARLVSLSRGLAPLPPGWQLGEPLRVGQNVAFTGCDEKERAALEAWAIAAGVRVTGSVTRQTAMLVTDGSIDGLKAATAAEMGTRVVHPREFAILLDHLQPLVDATPPTEDHVAASLIRAPEHTASTSGNSASWTGPSSAEVRDWARRNGIYVGQRGRISAALWDAYASAHS